MQGCNHINLENKLNLTTEQIKAIHKSKVKLIDLNSCKNASKKQHNKQFERPQLFRNSNPKKESRDYDIQ